VFDAPALASFQFRHEANDKNRSEADTDEDGECKDIHADMGYSAGIFQYIKNFFSCYEFFMGKCFN